MSAWSAVRAYALSLPNAAEDFPWGASVVKVEKRDGGAPPAWRRHLVHGPMFLWLGPAEDAAVAVKLTASAPIAESVAGATPTTHSGLGQWGWFTVPLAGVDPDLVCDWVDESYRNVAPRKLVRVLDAERRRR